MHQCLYCEICFTSVLWSLAFNYLLYLNPKFLTVLTLLLMVKSIVLKKNMWFFSQFQKKFQKPTQSVQIGTKRGVSSGILRPFLFFQQEIFLYCVGVICSFLLNALIKVPVSANPVACAICSTDKFPSRSISFARSSRQQSRYSCTVFPVYSLKSVEK